MAQTFKSILSAVIGSIITVLFGWLTLRSQLINKKADQDYVDKRMDKIEVVINNEHNYNVSEHDKIEERYLRAIENLDKSLRDIKEDVRDIRNQK